MTKHQRNSNMQGPTHFDLRLGTFLRHKPLTDVGESSYLTPSAYPKQPGWIVPLNSGLSCQVQGPLFIFAGVELTDGERGSVLLSSNSNQVGDEKILIFCCEDFFYHAAKKDAARSSQLNLSEVVRRIFVAENRNLSVFETILQFSNSFNGLTDFDVLISFIAVSEVGRCT